MKPSALVFAIIAAVVAGYFAGRDVERQRNVKVAALQAEQLAEAQDAYRQQLRIIEDHYNEKITDISTRRPATVERRVYVRADCVPDTGSSASVGGGENANGSGLAWRANEGAGRVALAHETVTAVASVADRYERLYSACSVRLAYWQDRHLMEKN